MCRAGHSRREGVTMRRGVRTEWGRGEDGDPRTRSEGCQWFLPWERVIEMVLKASVTVLASLAGRLRKT